MKIEFHIPTRPYSPIDAHNRAAAAKGSPRYAAMTSYADYNGHHVTLSWNSYRGYYVAEYYWAGRIVIARGTFEDCLKATLREHARGALGSSAGIYPREDDAEAIAEVARSTAVAFFRKAHGARAKWRDEILEVAVPHGNGGSYYEEAR